MSVFPSESGNLGAGTFAHTRHMNRAFLIESLVLLVFIAVCIALLVQLFVAAEVAGSNAHKMDVSARLSTDAAEVFAADPRSGTTTTYYDADGKVLKDGGQVAWTVTSDITAKKQTSGTLYHADITVTAKDGTAYDLATERYVSSTEGSGV